MGKGNPLMPSSTRQSPASIATPLLLALTASLVALSSAYWAGGDFLEQSKLAARWTARASFLVFLIAYSASALARLFPSPLTRAFVRRRRQWGLGFALAHTIHLGALVHYLTLSGETRPVPVLIGGGLGYVLMFAMALTSNNASQRALGRWWKRLHRTGIHYIWFIFLFSYAGRIADPERMHIGLAFVPIALTALGLRVAAWRVSARRSPSPAE